MEPYAIEYTSTIQAYDWLSVTGISEANGTVFWELAVDSNLLNVDQLYEGDFELRDQITGQLLYSRELNWRPTEPGSAEDDLLVGTSGHDSDLEGFSGNDTLYGLAGDDLLVGGDGVDILVGGLGDDDLQGGRGEDDYLVAAGEGQDTINDLNEVHSVGTKNKLKFGPLISPSQLRLDQFFDHAVIGLPSITDPEEYDWSVTIEQWADVYSEASGQQRFNYQTWEFHFEDGTVWSDGVLNGSTSGFIASGNDDILGGTGVGDDLFGLAGNDTITGGSGNDRIFGGAGQDTMSGEDGHDSYFFEYGDGSDVIYEVFDSGLSPSAGFVGSSIFLPEGADLNNVSFTYQAPYDLLVSYSAEDSILIKDWFLRSDSNRSTPILGSDFSFYADDVLLIGGQEIVADGGDYILLSEVEGAPGTFVDLMEGDDYLYGGFESSDLEIRMSTGNDVYNISRRIFSDTKNCTYKWSWGEGDDFIQDPLNLTSSSSRIIQLGDGILLEHLSIDKGYADYNSYIDSWASEPDGSELRLIIDHPDIAQTDLSGSIVIKDWVTYSSSWQILTSDGLVVDVLELPFVAKPRTLLSDSDGDRVPDIFEIARGSDELDSLSVPVVDALVDSNVVAPSSYLTLQEAIDSLPSQIGGEDYYSIVKIKPGVYEGEVIVPANKRVVFLAENHLGEVVLTSIKEGKRILDIASPASHFDGFVISGEGRIDSTIAPIHCELPIRGDVLGFSNCKMMNMTSKWGALDIQKGSVQLNYVTMFANHGTEISSVVTLSSGTDLFISDSIIWDNSYTQEKTPQISNVHANESRVIVTNSWIQGGEHGAFAEDPLINVNGDLLYNSPARDSSDVLNVKSVDIHGEGLDGVHFDAGADEFFDSDSDSLPDYWENRYEDLTLDASSDTEGGSGDLLLALDEYRLGTSPLLSDSDYDGFYDQEEALRGSPASFEMDVYVDSDGDRISDYVEISRGTDPSVATSLPDFDATVDFANTGNVGVFATLQEAVDFVPEYDGDGNPYVSMIRVVKGEYQDSVVIPATKQILFVADLSADGVRVQPLSFTAPIIESRSQYSAFDGFVFESDNDVITDSSIIRQNATEFRHSLLRLSNCIFRGFEVATPDVIVSYAGDIVLDHTTVTNVISRGFLVSMNGEFSDLYIRNSILWNNDSFESYTLDAYTSQLNILNSWITDGEAGANDSDPRITIEGYLLADSPLIDAGLPLGMTTHDVQGEARVDVIDVGADEYIDSDSDGRPDWLATQGRHYLLDENGDGIDLWDALFKYGIDDELLDFDGDGIPNDYEIAQGLDVSVANSQADYLIYLASSAVASLFTVYTEFK